MIYLRQSTASQEVPLGHFVDDTDGKTAETALTIANTDIKVWKMGATTLANKASGGGTHISGGIYYAVLDATDTDTIGPLVLFVAVSGALAVRLECCVLDEAVYDVWFGTTAPSTLGGTAQTGDGYAIVSSGTHGNAALKTLIDTLDDFVDTEVAAIKAKTDNLPSDPADASDIASSFTTVGTKLDTIDDFLDTEIAAIKAKTDNLPSDPADQSAVEAAITAAQNAVLAKLQGLVLTNGTIGSSGNDTTHLHLDGLTYGNDEINNYLLVIHDVSEAEYHARWVEDWVLGTELATVATLPFTPQNATDTYWLLPVRQDVTGGSGLDAAGVRSAVGLASANLDTQLGAIDDFLDTEIAAIKAKTDNLPSDPADASDIASSFTTVGTKLDTIDDFLDTEIAAIKAKTDNLPSDPADQSAVEAAITAAQNAVLAKLQGLVLTNGTIGSSGNDTTHLHLDGLTYGNDEINNYLLVIHDVSEAEYHARWVEDWVLGTELATVATLPFTPQNATDTYWLLPVRQDVTGGSGLDAAGVRSAVGLASANLDTQLGAIDDFLDTEIAAIKAKTDNLPASPAAVGSAMTLATGAITTAAIADDAITDAKIAVPAETSGRPSRILAMLRRAWEWTTNKSTRDRTTGDHKLFGADNVTVLETRTQSTASSVDQETKGA